MTSESPYKFLTASDVAELLKVSISMVYKLAYTGELPCHCYGRAKRFLQDDVDRFVRNSRVDILRQ